MPHATPSLPGILGRALIALTLLGFLVISFATKQLSLADAAVERTAARRR